MSLGLVHLNAILGSMGGGQPQLPGQPCRSRSAARGTALQSRRSRHARLRPTKRCPPSRSLRTLSTTTVSRERFWEQTSLRAKGAETRTQRSSRRKFWPASRADFRRLQGGQVALDLPVRELDAVLVPLLALEADVVVEDMAPERLLYQAGVGHLLDRLAQRLRQRDDAALLALLGRQVVEVGLHRGRELVVVLDSLETGVEQAGEGQVGIAGRIGAAELCSRAFLGARLVERNPDQRRAVALRPGDVDRRLVARDESLVGVDPLGEDRRKLARVLELPRDEALGLLREVVLVAGVEEAVSLAAEEGLMDMHARAVLAKDRLGHEGRVTTVLGRDLLHDKTVGEGGVGHRQRVGVAHVDLVLGGPDLVVRVLDLNSHSLQRPGGLSAELGGGVHGRLHEVAALVERFGALGVLEEEVLELGADVEGVETHRLHPLERPA